MKINTKTRYGIRTMIELALNNKGIYQKDISKNQDISFKYLDQIIAALKSSGLITTVAGKKSGYILTKHPSTIQIYDIYKAFNPELKVIDCLAPLGECNRSKQCAIQEFWLGMNNQIKDYMKSVYLNDLSKKQADINLKQQDLMFHI